MVYILTEDTENPGFYLLSEPPSGSTLDPVTSGQSIVTLPGGRLLMVRRGDGQLLTAMQPAAGGGEVVLGSENVDLVLRGITVVAEINGQMVDLGNLPTGGGGGESHSHEGEVTAYYKRWDSAGATWGDVPTPSEVLAMGKTHYWYDATHDGSATAPPYYINGSWLDLPDNVAPPS